jgi:hypothetical protein
VSDKDHEHLETTHLAISLSPPPWEQSSYGPYDIGHNAPNYHAPRTYMLHECFASKALLRILTGS